jgi:hypothetical protein
MRSRQELFPISPNHLRSAIHSLDHWLILAVVLISACGQASPQGLDELGGKPGVGVTTIYPQNPQLQVREKVQFVLKDANNQQIDGRITWSATGGTITDNGLYTAGTRSGSYAVSAKSRGSWATQKVTILSSSTSDPPDEPDSPDSPDDDPPSDPDDPAPANVLFADDFERADFRVWSGLASLGDPLWDGMGDGGAHIGDGYITKEWSRSGGFSWKALVDPSINYSYGSSKTPTKSSVERWRGMTGVKEFYITASYFIPSDYPAASTNIMQIKAAGSGSSHKPVAFHMRRDRTFAIYSRILGKNVLVTNTKLPLGRWFTLTGRFVVADDGLAEAWLDGQKIASVRTDTKDNDYAYPGVGNYIDTVDAVRCHIYIDDVKVSY